MYGILVLCFGNKKIACHSGATMAECIVLCVGYLSYVWDISLMYWILVLCLGYEYYTWDISLMYWVLVLCIGY